MSAEYLTQLLQQTLSPAGLTGVTEELERLETTPGFISSCLVFCHLHQAIVANKNIPQDIRLAAGIRYNAGVMKYWSANRRHAITEDEKANCRVEILRSTLLEEPSDPVLFLLTSDFQTNRLCDFENGECGFSQHVA